MIGMMRFLIIPARITLVLLFFVILQLYLNRSFYDYIQ